MDTRTDYRKYLKGLGRKRLDELAIFEIGGVGRLDGRGAPVMAALPQRNARRIIYRDIEVLDFQCNYLSREEYAPRTTQRLREHCSPATGVDALVLEWNGCDVPYPFPRESFDEFHSHMVTAHLVVPEQTEYAPSPEGFADEVTRLLRNEGRLYLSTDTPHFFGRGGGTTARGQERAELADRLIQRLRTNGFAIDVVDCHGSLKNHLQGRDYGVQVGTVNYAALGYFSRVSGGADIDLVLIATKSPDSAR